MMTQKRWIRRLCFLLAGVWLTLAAGSAALAEEGGNYRQRFARGVELFQAGEYEAALVEFDSAYRLRQHHAILLNMAYCYSEMGRLTDAIDHFERYLREGGSQIPAARRAVAEQEIQRLRALLVPLTINVNVPGATVRLDGREVGTSPLASPVQVRSGVVHNVEASLAGYRTASVEVAVAEGDTPPPLELELERLSGRLRVESNVTEAQVFLDGQVAGPVPWEGEVPVGEHVVEVRAERYQGFRRELTVEPGSELALTATLEPVGGSATLGVETEESGAVVFLDGRQVGVTPLAIDDLPAGVHRLRVERQGRVPWEGEVGLQADRTATARVELADPEGGLHRAWFWSTLGLGLSTGLAALVTGALAARQNRLVEDYRDEVEAGDHPEPQIELQATLDDMQGTGRALTISTDILWGTTAALAITTLVLGFFTRFGDPESSMQLEIGGALGEESAMVTAGGRF